MRSTRHVVSRRTAGLGDLLVNLLAAWRFAEQTGRTLVADWRCSYYLQDPAENLFGALFEPLSCLAGVPLVANDDLSDVPYAEPFHPALWTRALLDRPPERRAADEMADRDAAVALVRTGEDVTAPTVVFDGCINDALPSAARCREVLAELRPVADVRAKVEAFRAAHLDDRHVVAVHLRHGNGGATGDHARYWTDFDAAVERCAAAASDARARLGGDAVVFLATDAQPAAEAFLALVPETVVCSKFFRRPGDGELHWWPLAFVSRVEAMVDLLLLAECDALVRFPPGSFFSFYASVMKRKPPLGTAQERVDPRAREPLVVW
jgi:hypothetical protein